MVDASVSKTDEVTLVPVRSRPRVHEKIPDESQGFFVFFPQISQTFFCVFLRCLREIITKELLLRQISVNGSGGFLARAHREDDRGRATRRVTAAKYAFP